MIQIQLPEQSRVWVFMASGKLTEEQVSELSWVMNDFVQSWKSHGAELTAGWQLLYQSVLVIAVDENKEAPSGCSIDKVFRLLADFGIKHNLDFFNRLLMMLKNGENDVQIMPSSQLKSKIIGGELNMGTLVLNTSVSCLADAKQKLFIPVAESWLGKKILAE